jgi:hypothetical protein
MLHRTELYSMSGEGPPWVRLLPHPGGGTVATTVVRLTLADHRGALLDIRLLADVAITTDGHNVPALCGPAHAAVAGGGPRGPAGGTYSSTKEGS